MKKFVAGAAVIAAAMATSAGAQVYNPAAQGPVAANFVYGYVTGGSFTPWTAADLSAPGGCPSIGGTTCYSGSTSFLGTYFAPADGNYQGADLRAAEVTFHPGPNGEASALQFVAPVAGRYDFSGAFRAADAPFGNGTTYATPVSSGVLGLLGAPGGTVGFSFAQTLAAGQTAQFSLGANGSYSNDTTGFSLSVSAVPETATWGMMILGFGVMGAAMRRRRTDEAVFAA